MGHDVGVLETPTRYSVSDGVATITLNQPDSKNSLTPELVAGVCESLSAAQVDDEVRVVVLTNVGNTFCAGANLKASQPGITNDDPDAPTFVDLFKMILNSPKPVVARVDGHATGGGVGLVAACDISVMRDDAKIGFTEVRLGVAPAVISVVCLPKMNRADASELFLTGARFTPARAAEAGLINMATAPEQLDEMVSSVVGDLVRGGPNALAAAKELITRVPTMSTEDAFTWTEQRSRELFESAEAQAGIAAFVKRETAPWVPSES